MNLNEQNIMIKQIFKYYYQNIITNLLVNVEKNTENQQISNSCRKIYNISNIILNKIGVVLKKIIFDNLMT